MVKQICLILIVLVVAVTSVLICLKAYEFASQQKLLNGKVIYIDDQPQLSMNVKLENMAPGQKKPYEIHLKANEGDNFNIKMSFVKKGEDSLADFVDIEILVNGESVDKATLRELIDGKDVSFEAKIEEGTTLKLTVLCSMDISVGNEAQNTKADFDINLEAAG